MKKTLITVALLSLGVYGVLGQGAVNFNLRAPGAAGVGVVAPIYGPEPSNPALSLHGNATTNGGSTLYSGPLLVGTGFTIQLWAAPVGGTLAPLSTGTMRPSGSAFAGFNQPPSPSGVIVPGVPGGQSAIMDLRVWDSRGGQVTSWAQVMADQTILHGSSGQFTSLPLVEPPNTPPNLVGLTSFNVFAVPEPSVIALGALGLGALLLRRRKA